MAPVRNAVQVLHLNEPVTPQLQWAKDMIDRQMQVMSRLIDDLMDVSRISRGKIELRRERIDLAQILRGRRVEPGPDRPAGPRTDRDAAARADLPVGRAHDAAGRECF